MARIAGINIPQNKIVSIALTYIHGIGSKRANFIAEHAKIDRNKRVKDLTDAELGKIKDVIEENFSVEGSLRKSTKLDIDRLIRIRSHRGVMHRRGLPVRGQRTKTNARTRKGPVKLAVKNKAKIKK